MSNPDNLTQAQLWMLSLGAVLAEQNNSRHDILYGYEKTKEAVDSMKHVLNRDWGIASKSKLLNTLEWLITDGHGVKFLKDRYFISTLSETAQTIYIENLPKKSSKYVQSQLVKVYDKSLPQAGVLGWDYGRYIFLCRCAAATDLISEEEAWNLMLKAAKLAKKAYSSWREYGLAYIAGRQTWLSNISSDSAEDQLARIKPLIIDKNSPWNILDWNVKLE
jgi:hypothetical protein